MKTLLRWMTIFTYSFTALHAASLKDNPQAAAAVAPPDTKVENYTLTHPPKKSVNNTIDLDDEDLADDLKTDHG